MSNELAPKTGFALAPMDNSLLDMIREELDGLGSIPFDVVKIPSGGGVAFEVPGDDPDNPDVVKELTGVIIEHHPMNSYWACVFGRGCRSGLRQHGRQDRHRGRDRRVHRLLDVQI